ncbi:MAG TPA: hypothetical protein DDY49_02350 [Paenibacillaceae bacterium]|nr:hypothetical protein [Paenibacillaceae bacterium]
MSHIKTLIGSIYVRFIGAFLSTFIFSMLITVLLMNVTQFGNVEKMINSTFESRYSQLKALVENEHIELDKAIQYLSSSEVSDKVYNSINETGLSLSDSEIQEIEKGKIVTKFKVSKESRVHAIFKFQNKYVVITPYMENNPLTLFFSIQKMVISISIVLGTILILFTTITIVKPIKRISEASKKVADGDFSVQLPVNHVKGHNEVADLMRNFNRMVKELSRNEYLHKDFVSNVSHEFKTPITSLKGYAKLLKDKNLPEAKRQEYAEIIISESERLANLSSNLLKLSELENEAISIRKETFRLDEQIRDAVLLLQNQWENKNLEFDLDLDEITFTGDRQLMIQVWINLISNAIKYSYQNGLLRISLKQSKKIIAEIIDHGMGMSAEDLEKIFLRFYKADKSHNQSGTGLGLSIVKKIVELHDGSISVKSEPGKGSKFLVEL